MPQRFETLLLSNKDVEGLLAWDDIFKTVEKTWSEYALGKVLNPTKLGLDLGETGGWPYRNAFMNAMPAYIGYLNIAGLKWGGGFWNNVKKGLPSIWAMILLIDPETGIFKAAMEGALITTLRTAAQSVVGMRYLARKDFQGVFIFGAVVQGEYHARAISKAFPGKGISVYDTNPMALKKLSDKLKDEGIEVIKRAPEESIGSDVVITVTTSKTPFFRSEWVKRGHALFALGSYQEYHSEAIKKADKIVVDHIEQALHRGALKQLSERGEITVENIHATIGEIIAGKKPGRTDDEEVIFFVPIGTGMLDIAVAHIAYEKAMEKGVGSCFEFRK